jgi:pimeloyl-ACP methyl ester carboxylesterase
MFWRIFVVLLTLTIVLAAGWLALRRPDMPFDRLEFEYTNADSKFLTVDEDTRLHLRDVGARDAPAIVLVHGFSASLHTWEGWAKDLQKDYRVVSLDLPGHGLSGCIDNTEIGQTQFVEAVKLVADTLKLDDFTIVGNSMGGQTAWEYALAHPGDVNGLVLVDAAGWPSSEDERKNSPVVFRLLEYKLARDLMKDLDMTALVRSGLEDSFTNKALVTDEMVERYTALGRAPCHRDAIIALSSSRTERKPATPERLAAISTPTLIMHGEQDNLIPVSAAGKFGKAIPGAVVKIYPEVGHLPQEEVAEASLADLRAFLAALKRPEVTAEIPAPQP